MSLFDTLTTPKPARFKRSKTILTLALLTITALALYSLAPTPTKSKNPLKNFLTKRVQTHAASDTPEEQDGSTEAPEDIEKPKEQDDENDPDRKFYEAPKSPWWKGNKMAAYRALLKKYPLVPVKIDNPSEMLDKSQAERQEGVKEDVDEIEKEGEGEGKDGDDGK